MDIAINMVGQVLSNQVVIDSDIYVHTMNLIIYVVLDAISILGSLAWSYTGLIIILIVCYLII